MTALFTHSNHSDVIVVFRITLVYIVGIILNETGPDDRVRKIVCTHLIYFDTGRDLELRLTFTDPDLINTMTVSLITSTPSRPSCTLARRHRAPKREMGCALLSESRFDI